MTSWDGGTLDEREYLIVRGTVQQIVYYNDENGYAVLRLAAENGAEVTATGTFPNIGLGEEVILTGCWVTHPTYGEQFATEAFERRLPTSVRGIAEYLGSGLIRGIGPRLAAKIAEKFGEDTFDILMHEPERLSELRGITDRKAKEIGRQFTEQSEMRLLMDFLSEHGLPVALTPLLYKRLHDSAIDALCENPYLLCDPYYDVDFKLADGLAMELGLSLLSDERVDAGILYTLTFNLNNGHTFIPVEKLLYAVCMLLSDDDVVVDEDRALHGISRLEEKGRLVREHIAGRDAVYLRDMHDAEAYLAEMLGYMAERNYEYDFDVDELLSALLESSEFTFSEKQQLAISTAARNGLVILTGGPGTGKTTTVRGILQVFEALGLDTLLAAPTGRAAKRLSDLTGMEAKTIHRMLQVDWDDNDDPVFQRNERNPLECDAVVIDELSMVDAYVFESVLRALPIGCRLILVGDSDQLPSVGPGNVIGDLIASKVFPTVQLKEIFRQSMESLIVMNAHKIVEGELPELSVRSNDFFFMPREDAHSVSETVQSLVVTRLPKSYGYSPVTDIQVLCPGRKGELGTVELNRKLREQINPPAKNKPQVTVNGTVFREGDKVMQIKNDYNLPWSREDGTVGEGVYNGDMGIIIDVDKDAGCLRVEIDDKEVLYDFEHAAAELELAYAVTVHKSQGNEFTAVVMPMFPGAPQLSYRNLLYTGITRAKKLLILVGKRSVVADMVANDKKTRRFSGLQHFLLEKPEEDGPEQNEEAEA